MACTAAIHLWAKSAAACSSLFVPSAIFASWTSTSQSIHIPGVRDLKTTYLMNASVPEQSRLLYQFDERRYMRYTHSLARCPLPFPFPPNHPFGWAPGSFSSIPNPHVGLRVPGCATGSTVG